MAHLLATQVVDGLGHPVSYPYPPRRIASLSPSITASLIAMKLERELIGRSDACGQLIAASRRVPVVGAPSGADPAVLARVRPDILFVLEHQVHPEQLAELRTLCSTYAFKVDNFIAAGAAVKELARICGQPSRGRLLVEDYRGAYEELRHKLAAYRRAAVVLWRRPLTIAGREGLIQSSLEELGLYNIASSPKPERLSPARLAERRPSIVLVEIPSFDGSRVQSEHEAWRSELEGQLDCPVLVPHPPFLSSFGLLSAEGCERFSEGLSGLG